MKLSENFKVKEFACKGGSDIIYIDTDIEPKNYNKKVGGVKNSYHLKGRATNIQIKGISPFIVGIVASRYCANGIGVYKSFTHIDTRKNNSYWIG